MRRRVADEGRDGGHESRLRALGHLLDERRYERDGLCLLAVGGDFEVTGLLIPARGAAYDLVQQTERITAADLAAVEERLRRR